MRTAVRLAQRMDPFIRTVCAATHVGCGRKSGQAPRAFESAHRKCGGDRSHAQSEFARGHSCAKTLWPRQSAHAMRSAVSSFDGLAAVACRWLSMTGAIELAHSIATALVVGRNVHSTDGRCRHTAYCPASPSRSRACVISTCNRAVDAAADSRIDPVELMSTFVSVGMATQDTHGHAQESGRMSNMPARSGTVSSQY